MRVLRKVAGGIAFIAGLVVFSLGLLALADPAGAQLSNDEDPFGAPPSAMQLWAHLAVGAAIAAAGAWLVVRK